MKVLITNPFTWPRLRRGGERFLNELAAYLAGRGHQVTFVSAHPGPTESWWKNGYKTICYRRLWHPSMTKLGVWENHTFLIHVLRSFLTGGFDIGVCGTFIDTFGGNVARALRGTPVVFWVNGIPMGVRRNRALTLNGSVWRNAFRGADSVIALSEFERRYIKEKSGIDPVAIPPPVDMTRFKMIRERTPTPTIACAAALDEPRKGGRVLMRAFDLMKKKRPDIKLQIGGTISDQTRTELLRLVSEPWRSEIQFLGALDELPTFYGRAWVSVLPSMWEPFGMVMIESLATGTPVVGADSGAIPEVITSPEIGRLFDPGSSGDEATNAEGLAAAITETLQLTSRPETAERCRNHASLFSWDTLGPQYEQLLAKVAESAR
jgi:phosphatidylinositol alpha-mannosyltransferase